MIDFPKISLTSLSFFPTEISLKVQIKVILDKLEKAIFKRIDYVYLYFLISFTFSITEKEFLFNGNLSFFIDKVSFNVTNKIF